MKRPIITIAGSLGSGKSSTAKAVASALGYEHLSSGDVFRKMAQERGVSVEAINIAAEVQKDIDHEVDAWLDSLKDREKIVVDSRMAWKWIPDSFKVFLALDPATAAERIFANNQQEGRMSENASSVAEVRASIDARFASEQKRYLSLYGVNPTDPLNFDIFINTKFNDLESVTAMLLAAYHAWREK
jgi:cytidylate kinase